MLIVQTGMESMWNKTIRIFHTLITFSRSAALFAGRLTSSYRGDKSDEDRAAKILEITRMMAKSLADTSTSQVADFVRFFIGPSECIELLFLQDYAGVATSHQYDNSLWTHVFAIAVRKFGAGDTGWEHIIRNLLRRGQSVHDSDKYTDDSDDDGGTLLDQLFYFIDTPFQAEEVGYHWLQILSSEGFDVVTYLKEEMALHAPYQLLKQRLRFEEIPLRLVCSWEERLGISWEWVNDPASPIISLQDEFKTMINWPIKLSFHCCEARDGEYWELFWPLFPQNYDFRMTKLYGCERCKNMLKRQYERATQRMRKKAAKLARSQRTKGPRSVPGAWPV